MTPVFAIFITTVIAVILFQLIDWLFWGTPWAHRSVFPLVPKELWRFPMDGGPAQRAGARQAMFLGIITTVLAAVFFVPMVWIAGPRFAGARAVLFALLLWAALLLPATCTNSIYYRIPPRMLWVHAAASLARVVLGLVVVTWLLTTFRAW